MRRKAIFSFAMVAMCLICGTYTLLSASDQSVKAKWTVMVYMNAKNDLECFALHNFAQMASAGSSERVNVLVELGRLKQHQSGCDEKETRWSGILRYRITKGITPTRHNALPRSLAKSINDMGSKATLSEFISWAMKEYPADHYMMIIWNHGQGWRLEQRVGIVTSAATPDAANSSLQIIYGGVRSVSYDDETHHRLFNADISGALQENLGNNVLDVIGFDACLMSMVETAYQMKDVARYMVGSEELEPGAGWNYEALLRGLEDGKELAESVEMLKEAYAQDYSETHATLDFVDLSQVRQLAGAVTSWANSMRHNLGVEGPILRKAREECIPYGRWYRKSDPSLQTSIDLHRLASLDAKYTNDASVQSAASKIVNLIESPSLIKTRYASEYSDDRLGYGSWGLAIYFPASKQAFEADKENSSGYRVQNSDHPVAFVGAEAWAGFLQEYYNLPNEAKVATQDTKR